MERGRAGP